jgi:hypothetical protein
LLPKGEDGKSYYTSGIISADSGDVDVEYQISLSYILSAMIIFLYLPMFELSTSIGG